MALGLVLPDGCRFVLVGLHDLGTQAAGEQFVDPVRRQPPLLAVAHLVGDLGPRAALDVCVPVRRT